MGISIADHIFQDRELFTFTKAEIIEMAPNKKLFTYSYDKKGIAKIQLSVETDNTGSSYGFLTRLVLSDEYGENIRILENIRGGIVDSGVSDPCTYKTVVKGEELHGYLGNTPFGKWSKEQIYEVFGDYEYESTPPDEDDATPPSQDSKPTIPSKDYPPQIWGYNSEDIEEVKGYVKSEIPIYFRAFDDFGIDRFYACELKAHENDEIEVLTPFKPVQTWEYGYKFNLYKEFEGTYQYKIYAYDTSSQRGVSNVFNVVVEPPITDPSYAPTPPPVSDSEHIVLYDKNENDFTANGIGILDNDIVECIVDKEENGAYELTVKYLSNGKYSDYLLDTENIIKCKSDMSNNISQLFRIYNTEYIMQENIIVVKAQHITYDLKDLFIESIHLIDVTCRQATQTLISKAIGNTKFVVNSDVDMKANFRHERVNVLECITGIENSIFDVYGKTKLIINRDNFNYSINKEVENDKGVIIVYSKNLLGFKRSIDTSSVICGIYPYAYLRTGACINLEEKVIYSQYKDNYATPKIKAVDFTSDTVVDVNSLRSVAQNYMDNGCDIPKINYEIDFILLYSNSGNRDKYRALEEIAIGDTITVQDSKMGINVKARVIRTVYNVLKNKYEKIELGNFRNEYRTSKKTEYENIKKIIRNTIK